MIACVVETGRRVTVAVATNRTQDHRKRKWRRWLGRNDAAGKELQHSFGEEAGYERSDEGRQRPPHYCSAITGDAAPGQRRYSFRDIIRAVCRRERCEEDENESYDDHRV